MFSSVRRVQQFTDVMVREGKGALMKFDETDFLRARPYIAMLIALSISFR
jgi:hypothetical protein